ncbi:cell division protein FtsQ/DivIB [Anoxynatronum buryatiense]|nr:FtsQ-type POTRA domain-containing protein [Anoxynatronum buryatiense]
MTQKKYRKKKKGNPWIRMILTLVVIGLMGGTGYYFVFNSPLFTVKTIQIEGLSRLDQDAVAALSEITLGDQFYGASLKQAAEKIESHPYIRNAILTRKGFSTINIVVREREEYAIIPYMGSYIYLDQERVVLNVTDGILDSNLCLVTGIKFISFQTGDTALVQNEESLETAYQILGAAREAEILDMISEINIDETGQVKVVTFNGIEALFGYMDNPAYSVLALKEALITLHTRNMNSVIIDMRYEGHITVQDRARQEDEDDKP